MSPRPLLAACLVACAPGAPDAPPSPEALAAEVLAPGPAEVGHLRAQVTYRPVGADEDRTVPVDVWFPGLPGSGGAPAVYAVAGIGSIDAPLAREDVAPADGPHPVALYSHGAGGMGLLAYPYAERLASHGWVVVAPDHVGNTTLDSFLGRSDPFARIALNRPQDLSAVLDALEAGRLVDDAAVAEVLLIGHSFGAYTVLALAGAGLDVEQLTAGCTPESTDATCVIHQRRWAAARAGQGHLDRHASAVACPARCQTRGWLGCSLA